MSTLFEYDKTEVEEGYYILRVSCDGLTFLTVAQFMLGSWYITGADYDMWRWSDGEKPKIEIICGLDLDKIAVAAKAEPVATDAMVRAYKEAYLKHCEDALNGRIPRRAEDFTFEASRKGIAAALAAMEQQGAPVDSRDEALSPSGNREMAKSLYEAFQYKTKHGSRADDAFIAIVSSALAAKEQQP